MPHTNHRLPLPNNATANVLHLILNRGAVSERDTNYNSFRARISDLKNPEIHNLPLKFREIEFTNEYGRKKTYREHYLLKKDFPQAIRLYNQINRA